MLFQVQEVLIALGYSVGTEQISNLVQFGTFVINRYFKKKGSYDNISILLLLSIPVLVFSFPRLSLNFLHYVIIY